MNPMIIDDQYSIIAGHGRILAAKEEGLPQIPCVFVKHLSETQKKAYILADNKLALNAGWDMEMLKLELDELKELDFNIELTGFDFGEIAEMEDVHGIDEVEEDDFTVETPEVPVSKRGDVWLLGKHRLRCGDSTSQADVDILMDGRKARLIVTDSPYNVSYGNTSHPSWKQRSIMNDSMPAQEFQEFLRKVFTCAYQAVEPGAAIFAFMSAQEWGRFMPVLEDIGWHWSSTIIWVKDTLVLGRKDWQPRYEGIFYGWRGDAPRLYPLKETRTETDVWEFDRPKKSPLHPTQKPIEVMAKAVHYCSREGDIILDLFSGSASTLIAAEQLGRVAYLQELDEKYVDVGVRRYIEHKGSDDSVFLLRDGERIPFKESGMKAVE